MRDLVKLDTLRQVGSASTPDLRLNSTISSVSSSSENQINEDPVTSSSSIDQFEDTKDEEDLSMNSIISLPSSTIYASEFPCYHHLMKAISKSHKRSLQLWNGDEEESILKNGFLISLTKQAAKGKGHGSHWSDGHMQLYKDLAKWRLDASKREFVSASEICNLDFLVYVAYKMPISRNEMRRWSFRLPAVLADERPYCDELCELVTSSEVFRSQGHPTLPLDVIFYSDEDTDTSEMRRERRRTLYKLLIATAIVGTIFLTVTKRAGRG